MENNKEIEIVPKWLGYLSLFILVGFCFTCYSLAFILAPLSWRFGIGE